MGSYGPFEVLSSGINLTVLNSIFWLFFRKRSTGFKELTQTFALNFNLICSKELKKYKLCNFFILTISFSKFI